MSKKQSRKQRVLKLLVSLGLLSQPILALSSVSEAVTSTYATEQAMIDAGGVNPTLTDAYNRAERILPAPIGELHSRDDLITYAENYFAQLGFDRNLLTWADISPIPLSDPWFDSDPEWACPSSSTIPRARS